MVKILLVLVFSMVLALPFRSVLGQEDWKDFFDQGGLPQDALDKAKRAFGGAAAQAAVDDYFGAALGGGSPGSSSSDDDADDGEGSSLADFLDDK